jgi:hypothetical protein
LVKSTDAFGDVAIGELGALVVTAARGDAANDAPWGAPRVASSARAIICAKSND